MIVNKSTFRISDEAVDDFYRTYMRNNAQKRQKIYIGLQMLFNIFALIK
jgi:hypothetical protein